MKTFENYNSDEKEMEELFLQLAHLDELEIKFDFIKSNVSLYYFYKGSCLFINHKKSEFFYIDYNNIWRVFELKYHMTYHVVDDNLLVFANKYFKLKDYMIDDITTAQRDMIDKSFQN